MTEEINKGGIRVYISDERYPTLVMEGDGWLRGYDINKETGELTPCCICAARYSGECCCDYDWKEENV